MVDRVQVTRYYNAWQRPPTTDVSGELYVNYADIQIGALDLSHSPVDFVAVRYYSQTSKYVEGDYAIYNGYLYKCIMDTPNPAGPFDNSRWSEIPDLQEIQVLIDIETQRAEAAEAHLQDEINAEIARAEAAEAALQIEINGVETSLNSLIPPGISLEYYGPSAPAGWLLEDGAIYNISTYPALGALLGGKYGGNGTTTFAVPNSLGRFGIATGSSFPLGSTGGSASSTLDLSHLPAHTHTIQSHTHTGNVSAHSHQTVSVGGYGAISSGVDIAPGTGGAGSTDLSTLHTGNASPGISINGSGTLTTDSTGSSSGSTAPVATLPPYISRTRIIKI